MATMDAIKKKMMTMKIDKENAFDKAETLEQKLKDVIDQKSKVEEDLNIWQKKYALLENDFDIVNENLIAANIKREAAEKRVAE
ncbi:unnamed protein product, partial [Candidula unifasciata]